MMLSVFFFFNDTATTEIYTLSLHDALPISGSAASAGCRTRRPDERPERENETRPGDPDRKSTRLNSSHDQISYAVFCLKKKKDRPYIITCLLRTGLRDARSGDVRRLCLREP